MKVLLVNNYWYRRGGSETVLFTTKRLLEAAGHTVVCFGLEDERNTIEPTYTVPVPKDAAGEYIHGWHSIYNKKALELFRRCLQEEAPDIIHVHNIYHHISFSICDEIRRTGIPAVYTAHDYKLTSLQYRMYHHGHIDTTTRNHMILACVKNVMESYPRTIAAVIEYSIRRLKRWNHTFAAYISPSSYMANMLAQGNISPTKIATIPNPIDDTWFRSSLTNYRDTKGIFFFGRMEREKGAHIVERIARALPHIPVTIAGDGSYLPSASNITHLGHLSPAALRTYIDAARIVLIPSEWPENAPMSMVESLARGAVVLGSDIGGIPEWLPDAWVVRHYQSVAAWTDRIRYWYGAHPTEVDSYRNAAMTMIQKVHNETVYQQQIMKVYQEVL